MERKKIRMREHCSGTLPSKAPLANPYVPFQSNDPLRYETRKGYVRGTLYPGLDLPFKGMVNNHEKAITPSNQMQTSGFALQELALYLDTHPNDKKALELYRKYQKEYHKNLAEYSERVMPVSHLHGGKDAEYCWLRDPWPWEFSANKEG